MGGPGQNVIYAGNQNYGVALTNYLLEPKNVFRKEKAIF